MSANIQQAIIDDKIAEIESNFGYSRSRAFLSLVYALASGSGWGDLDDDDITDGGDDTEMDVISIQELEAGRSARVIIIAGSTTQSHKTTELQRLSRGLHHLLVARREEYETLPNVAFRDKIREFRQLRTSLGSSNVVIKCYFATPGDSTKRARMFETEVKSIQQGFSTESNKLELMILGAQEIVKHMELAESKGRRIDTRLHIDYDTNRGSIVSHTIPGIDGIVCTVTAQDIAKLVLNHPGIFDINLRQYLGTTISVNSDIYLTCSDPEQSHLFWFLNNGITIVCESFSLTTGTSDDRAFLDIKDLHIVNGCQTSSAMADALETGTLHKDAKVLVRVFSARSKDLADRVVISTNTQNKIVARDLCSNTEVQKDIQRVFKSRFGLFYERQRNEFSSVPRDSRQLVVSNEKVGQAFLSIVMRKPSDGARRKYKLWGDQSAAIFNSHTAPETYLICFLLVERCKSWCRSIAGSTDEEISRRIIKQGAHHIARMACYEWRQGDSWSDESSLREQLSAVRASADFLDQIFVKSARMLIKIIKSDEDFVADVDAAMKSGELDRRIDRNLHGGDGSKQVKRKTVKKSAARRKK